ncbi:hypothetical protein QFC19_007108 [Naganishia cerealis]|uniref:Uncharacterized protein n=1 Tax=Naganishia cerealis TaxID=610337 RepID=A0ACC2VBX8_9TREE|nr:hypothetical protein QFC19_007108 [Naganishia cerealis]
MEAFYGNDSFGSFQGPRVEDEKNHLKRSRPYAPEYPTFARGGLDDPESQIPDINGEKASYIRDRGTMETIEEEVEDLTEEVIENTRLNARSSALFQESPQSQPESKRIPPPQIPAEIAALPDSIQQMWRGVQPRFGAEQTMAVPKIQLEPSTPSTIASGSQSIKLSRPDTLYSTSSSGTASTDSTAAERYKIISRSSQAFPIPPERAVAPVAPPRSRPKAHLVNRKMDDTRLMPPKKSALRRHSQFTTAASECQSSIVELSQSSKASARSRAPERKEDVSRRSFVRFDLHRISACSTDTTSSLDSGLSDILPPKPRDYRKPNSEGPIETVIPLQGPEGDKFSIYSGIAQDVPRIDTTASPVKKRPSPKAASPSRLSYLLTEESSPQSPFSDIHAFKPDSTLVEDMRSVCSARTVSTVYMSADESTANAAPVKPLARLPLSDPALCANTINEAEFVAKKKKRMSHLAV